MQQPAMEQFYLETIELWQGFCKLHTELYDITIREYRLLLNHDADAIGPLLDEKESLIQKIRDQETSRRQLIQRLQQQIPDHPVIEKASDLIALMEHFENQQGQDFLQQYNEILLALIERIQKQNKITQIYINKSMHTFQDLQRNLWPRQTYCTYNSQGISNTIVINR